MSLTTAQLVELQSISETLRINFPFNGSDQWWAAIRILDGGLGPTSGSGGQSAFDATISDMLATQLDIQNRQGVLGSQQTGFREATLQVVSTTGAAAVPSIAKPSDTPRSNDDVISPDPHLFFTGVQPGLYNLGGLIIVDGPANADMKFQMTLSAGGVFGTLHLLATIQQDLATSSSSAFVIAAAVDLLIPLSDGSVHGLVLTGSIEIVTAGTLEFSWAQVGQQVAATTIQQDSFLTLSDLIVAA